MEFNIEKKSKTTHNKIDIIYISTYHLCFCNGQVWQFYIKMFFYVHRSFSSDPISLFTGIQFHSHFGKN